MRRRILLFVLGICALITSADAAPAPLFDGSSFHGWEGSTTSVWRIVDGNIVGGSFQGNPQNEFLATEKAFKNFHLRLEYKIVGREGFVNGGVQFRSKRIADPANEMSGYQADIGAGYSGFLYDESRRKKFLAEADQDLVAKVEKLGDWNRYEIIAKGRHVEIVLNGHRTASWTESEGGIDESGLIALQIHGNCKAEISFRNISIEEFKDSTQPSGGTILRRLGTGQPSVPFPIFLSGRFDLTENEAIAFIGQENFVREQKSGGLEARLSAAHAINTPRFRPMAWEADTVYQQWRDLNFGSWSEQLQSSEISIIIAQFGQMEALDGAVRLPEFTAAYHRLLDQFAARTRRLVLVSPMPFEKPLASHAPDLTQRNDDAKAYADAVRQIAAQRKAIFVDLFTPLSLSSKLRLTDDGIHLNDDGLDRVAGLVAAALDASQDPPEDLGVLREAIVRKNQLWFDCWRPANWSFVYGDRVNQKFGKAGGKQSNLQSAFEQQLPLVEEADRRIAVIASGNPSPALRVSTPKQPSGEGALDPDEQLATFSIAEGYSVDLFASEEDGVVNPTQFAWDERGRLYVACSPSYPQSLASDPPSDYILICEDTNGDGRADKSWRFAEGLTMVQGVEPGAGGVYVCDFDRLLFLQDTSGDGKADQKQIVLSGFGVGDTHQLINSICHGPEGDLWFSQGLHAMSRVETPWGIARLDRAALWRLDPRTLRLEGFFGGGMAGANCWGIAFDDFGQIFHKSGDRPHGYWSVPGLVRGSSAGGSGSDEEANASYRNSPLQYHSVGPLFETSPKTTSLDIIGTRALPDEIQGCALIAGYFGSVIELHRFEDAGSGFKTTQLPRLLTASNNAFRPVDVSVGPDGAIYVADWYNPIIGHYQASYADPRRDKSHGRIWRISANDRPRVEQPDLSSMPVTQLLEQLASEERWTRYQAKRLLFSNPTKEVVEAADEFAARCEDDQILRELIGVYASHKSPRPKLLSRLLTAEDPRLRAYATRIAGIWPDAINSLRQSVNDKHPRVRLEAIVAASYVPSADAVAIATSALEHPRDPFIDYALHLSASSTRAKWSSPFTAGQLKLGSHKQDHYLEQLLSEAPQPLSPGEELYQLACLTCHQPDGKGLSGVYPPLTDSGWLSDEAKDDLIKIVLHGLSGPVTVAGQTYGDGPTAIPMPPMSGLSDKQIADVLTYIRKTFGSNQTSISAEEVEATRDANPKRTTPWTVEELKQQ